MSRIAPVDLATASPAESYRGDAQLATQIQGLQDALRVSGS